MLETGAFTNLPSKYRITLAISFALFLHSLVGAGIKLFTQAPEREQTSVRFVLIPPGSQRSQPQQASQASLASETSKPIAETRPEIRPEPQPKSQSETGSEPFIRVIKPDQPSPTTAPEPQVARQQPPTPERTAREASEAALNRAPSRATPESPPSPQEAGVEEAQVSQISTSRNKQKDPYTLALEIRISKEMSQQPVPEINSLKNTVKMEMELHLMNNGALRQVGVKRSTGIASLDQSAVRAALRASPYPEPSGGKDLRYRVELTFSPERI